MAPGEPLEERSKDDKRQQIKVTDRRHFTAAGERRDEGPDDSDEMASPAAASRDVGARRGETFERRPIEEPEGVDFTMLINAMAQPALLFLGEIPDPGTGAPTVDLVQAKLQIDMLDLLRVKCRGNLSLQEEALLERVLYELRMRYVSRAGRPG